MKVLLGCLLAALSACAAELLPLHSHNDYERAEPLQGALKENIRSVEVDVHLVGSELLVAHDPREVQPGRTIEKLYLDPLKARFDGRQFRHHPPLMLLVDLKTPAEATFSRLEQILQPYASMLTRFEKGQVVTNHVQVVVSGNRPIALMKSLPQRLTFCDGRLADLGKNEEPALMPLVSDNWNSQFTWRGEGEFPPAEKEKLKALVTKTRQEQKLLRFWAHPDSEPLWRELRQAGVDLINTDDVSRAAKWLRVQPAAQP